MTNDEVLALLDSGLTPAQIKVRLLANPSRYRPSHALRMAVADGLSNQTQLVLRIDRADDVTQIQANPSWLTIRAEQAEQLLHDLGHLAKQLRSMADRARVGQIQDVEFQDL